MATKAKTSVAQSTTATGGININGISPIQTALNDYINAIVGKCDLGATTAQIQAAVRGTASEQAVINMYKSIQTQMQDYVRQLRQYSQVLDNMKANYAKNDASTGAFRK